MLITKCAVWAIMNHKIVCLRLEQCPEGKLNHHHRHHTKPEMVCCSGQPLQKEYEYISFRLLNVQTVNDIRLLCRYICSLMFYVFILVANYHAL